MGLTLTEKAILAVQKNSTLDTTLVAKIDPKTISNYTKTRAVEKHIVSRAKAANKTIPTF